MDDNNDGALSRSALLAISNYSSASLRFDVVLLNSLGLDNHIARLDLEIHDSEEEITCVQSV